MPYITLENGKKVKISNKSYRALAKAVKEENNEILVPDNIKIENHCGDGDNLGIVFNEGKQTLAYNSNRDVWYVLPAYSKDFVKCNLVPVNKEDLKVGYTYFRTDSEQPDFSDMRGYCKYLGDESYVFVEYGDSVVVSNFGYKKWYQVVPINEN